ncbi:MAG TPA: hypothetical protein VGB63_08535 [Pedobacter sp.]|jgi:hypothetical protein
MEDNEEKIISAPTEEQLWDIITADFKNDPDPLEYHSILEQQGRRIILDIFNNHAVGFEAIAFTSFNSFIYDRSNFRFTIHNEGFKDEIAKIFGMQDIVLGYKDFDEKFIIKTNDENKTATLFADPELRATLLSLPSLSFSIVEYTLDDGDGKAPFLELKLAKSVTDIQLLRKVYNAFYKVLQGIEI